MPPGGHTASWGARCCPGITPPAGVPGAIRGSHRQQGCPVPPGDHTASWGLPGCPRITPWQGCPLLPGVCCRLGYRRVPVFTLPAGVPGAVRGSPCGRAPRYCLGLPPARVSGESRCCPRVTPPAGVPASPPALERPVRLFSSRPLQPRGSGGHCRARDPSSCPWKPGPGSHGGTRCPSAGPCPGCGGRARILAVQPRLRPSVSASQPGWIPTADLRCPRRTGRQGAPGAQGVAPSPGASPSPAGGPRATPGRTCALAAGGGASRRGARGSRAARAGPWGGCGGRRAGRQPVLQQERVQVHVLHVAEGQRALPQQRRQQARAGRGPRAAPRGSSAAQHGRLGRGSRRCRCRCCRRRRCRLQARGSRRGRLALPFLQETCGAGVGRDGHGEEGCAMGRTTQRGAQDRERARTRPPTCAQVPPGPPDSM